ncbi:alternate-type signal peptide domain-containing protein [Jonesiaceae bacterium BS-20]|uniref:Alternate-type signal peptide domain-containing protein n=1 Tax=Jonesiaceae bacterium BS-20 TaxID=3120821 RepID=A0AAU7DWB3_9MICO
MLLEKVVPETKKNSKLKGGIAIALGAALLAGGGGTLAYWSTNQTLQGTSINTGDLNLELGAATWTLTHGTNSPVTVGAANINDLEIVPGDKLELVQMLDVTLKGDNLKADLTIDTSGVTDAANVTIAASLAGGAATQELSPADSGDSIAATVTVVFADTTGGQIDVNEAINLNAIDFTLTQKPL